MIQIVSSVGLMIGLLVSIVLIVFAIKQKSANWLLGVSLIFLWYALVTTELYRTGAIVDFPAFSRTGNIAGFLVTPFLYFFVKQILYRGESWSKKHWWVFVPAIFYLVDYFPYFVLPNVDKIAFIQEQQLGVNNFKYAEGWITTNWLQYHFRQFWSLLFIFLTLGLLWKNRVLISNQKNSKNQRLFIFILVLTFLYAITFVPGYVRTFIQSDWYNLTYQSITGSITLISCAVFLMFNPAYLYGFYWEEELQLNVDNLRSKDELQVINSVDKSLCKALDKYIDESNAYRNPTYSIHDLSKDIGIPVYKISPAINSVYASNFNHWLNTFRVREFEKLANDKRYQQLPLDQLSEKCGFTNRTTFTNACKKTLGDTPGNFLKDKLKANTA